MIDYINLKLPKNKFNIIHFRLSDNFNINKKIQDNNIKIPKEYLQSLENIFVSNYEKNDILLTNNENFKNYIKNKYNCSTFYTKIFHLGLLKNNTDKKIIMDSLLELFIQAKSHKIKTYSDYKWISRYVYWNSKIYNIPLIDMKSSKTKYFIIGFRDIYSNYLQNFLKINKYRYSNYNENLNLLITDFIFVYDIYNLNKIKCKYNTDYELIFILNTTPIEKWLVNRYTISKNESFKQYLKKKQISG